MTQSLVVQVEWNGRSDRIEYRWLGRERAAMPLLVFLHEGLGSVAMWKDFPQTLCDALGWRGLVFSRSGYGKSTPREHGELWPIDFMHRQARDFLPAFFAALGLDPAATLADRPWLFGHSDGASIALIHAALFPELVAGLIVVAPHLFVEEVSIKSIREAREAYIATDLRERLAAYHDDPDSAFWGWNDVWLDPNFKSGDIVPLLPRIACPILAVQGTDDHYGTMEQIESIGQGVPRTELVKLAACGHSPHRDRPQAVVDAVRAFTTRHGESPGKWA